MTEADPSAREDARSAARERQSHVRHDLRSPLAVMYPLLSLLLGETAGELKPKQREYLETMERSVERLERLLVSAMESGWMDCSTAPAEPSAVSLHQVAEEAIALALRDGPGDQEIRVSGEAPPARACRATSSSAPASLAFVAPRRSRRARPASGSGCGSAAGWRNGTGADST